MRTNSKPRPFSMKYVLFWLSGAGTETLERCPTWEQRKYAAFGATVLVPCLFAFAASAYALSTITEHYWVIFPVALVWAFIVLTIDRALLSSYRPYQHFLLKSRQFLLRFLMAFLMGLTVAHPLVLLLFKDSITAVIEHNRQGEVAQLHAQYTKEWDQSQARIATLEQSIAEQRTQWDHSYQAKFSLNTADSAQASIPGLSPEQQHQLDKAIADASAPIRQALNAAEQQVSTLTPPLTKVQLELAFWQAEFEKELNGQRSGIKGIGPRARSIQDDQLNWRRAEVNRLSDQLKHFSAEKTAQQALLAQTENRVRQEFQTALTERRNQQKAEEKRVADLKHQIDQDQASQFVSQQREIRDTIKSQIDARLADLRLAQQQSADIRAEERQRVDLLLAEPRHDILTQTLALHVLFDAKDKGGEFAYSTYVILVLLFMLVDTIPVIVKFFGKPGPYDTLLDQDEVRFDAERQAFLARHQNNRNGFGNKTRAAEAGKGHLDAVLMDSSKQP